MAAEVATMAVEVATMEVEVILMVDVVVTMEAVVVEGLLFSARFASSMAMMHLYAIIESQMLIIQGLLLLETGHHHNLLLQHSGFHLNNGFLRVLNPILHQVSGFNKVKHLFLLETGHLLFSNYHGFHPLNLLHLPMDLGLCSQGILVLNNFHHSHTCLLSLSACICLLQHHHWHQFPISILQQGLPQLSHKLF